MLKNYQQPQKYWKIILLHKAQLEKIIFEWEKAEEGGFVSYIIDTIGEYLGERGFGSPQDSSIVIDANKYTFKLVVEVDIKDNTVAIIIENNSNWIGHTWDNKPFNCRYPPIIILIQDFFKFIKYKDWYLLETLRQTEVETLEFINRAITPLKIIKRLDDWNPEENILMPDILHIGECDHDQTVIYKGDKKKFKSIFEFWISCLKWIEQGEIDPNNPPLESFIKENFYNSYYGLCKPYFYEEESMESILEKIETVENGLKKVSVKSTIFMRGEADHWDDQRHLIEYENCFIMYNWWTAE